MEIKHVVIVGGGFGGLNAAKALAGNSSIHVTLIDKRNYHLFQPLLYQVAMAGLSPAEIATPIRAILSGYKNVSVVMEKAQGIDSIHRVVKTENGKEYAYDYLILACGAESSYFAHPEWERLAPGLKSIEDATEIRGRVLTAFEKAEIETDLTKQKALLTFLIVGGGPTGVELAGALSEISKFTFSRDFKNIDPSRTRIILVEGGRRILAAFSEESAKKATHQLESMGVHVWTNTRVSEIRENGVVFGSEFIEASTILWAAGVKTASINSVLGLPLDPQGRVIVGEDLAVEGHSEIFVIGDQAHVEEKPGKVLPGLAQVAIQSGMHAAKMILADIGKKSRWKFHYVDKGNMATIGRKKAIAEIGKIKLSGFLAWWIWLVVHVYFLIGFKNRFFVLYQWAWSYFTYKRGARLITDNHQK